MARKTVAQYFSDLSGSEIGGDNPTVKFSLGATSYEIDLTAEEQETFRSVLEPYLSAGRKASSRRRSGGPTPKEVRAWAVEQGHDIPSRGRIPGSVLEAYSAAH
jgi:hypothetical protein